jgi:hypothetical protein
MQPQLFPRQHLIRHPSHVLLLLLLELSRTSGGCSRSLILMMIVLPVAHQVMMILELTDEVGPLLGTQIRPVVCNDPGYVLGIQCLLLLLLVIVIQQLHLSYLAELHVQLLIQSTSLIHFQSFFFTNLPPPLLALSYFKPFIV